MGLLDFLRICGLLFIVVRRRFACLGLRCGFWVCFVWGFLRLGLLVGLGWFGFGRSATLRDFGLEVLWLWLFACDGL